MFRLAELAKRVPFGLLERAEFHLVVLYDAGRTTHEVDFVPHACRGGSLVHASPGQANRFRLGPSVDGLALVFPPTLIPPAKVRGSMLWQPEFFEDLRWPALLQLPSNAARAAGAALRQVRSVIERVPDGPLRAPLLQQAVGASLLEIAAHAGLAPPPRRLDDTDAERARAFRVAVERSFRVTRRVADYAEALKCSVRTLDRLAQAREGMTAKELIDARVILEARRLLAHDPTTIATLADTLGFSEPTNFVKFFRKRTGESPGRFRTSRRLPP